MNGVTHLERPDQHVDGNPLGAWKIIRRAPCRALKCRSGTKPAASRTRDAAGAARAPRRRSPGTGGRWLLRTEGASAYTARPRGHRHVRRGRRADRGRGRRPGARQVPPPGRNSLGRDLLEGRVQIDTLAPADRARRSRSPAPRGRSDVQQEHVERPALQEQAAAFVLRRRGQTRAGPSGTPAP